MRPTIIAKGVEASETLREYIMERLGSVLESAQDSIDYITVRLTDLNGSKGGIDKRCLINVKLPGRPHIVITEIASDITSAIDGAAYRASLAVGRVISRAKSISRATMPLYMSKSFLAV